MSKNNLMEIEKRYELLENAVECVSLFLCEEHKEKFIHDCKEEIRKLCAEHKIAIKEANKKPKKIIKNSDDDEWVHVGNFQTEHHGEFESVYELYNAYLALEKKHHELEQECANAKTELTLARNEINTLSCNLEVSRKHDEHMTNLYFGKCKDERQIKLDLLDEINEMFVGCYIECETYADLFNKFTTYLDDLTQEEKRIVEAYNSNNIRNDSIDARIYSILTTRMITEHISRELDPIRRKFYEKYGKKGDK